MFPSIDIGCVNKKRTYIREWGTKSLLRNEGFRSLLLVEEVSDGLRLADAIGLSFKLSLSEDNEFISHIGYFIFFCSSWPLPQ